MKKVILSILLIFSMLAFIACGQKESAEKTKKNPNKHKNEYGTVTLCDYKNLSAEKIIYEVREEEIQEEIASYLEEYIDYADVKRPLENGDNVCIAYKAYVDGELIEEMKKKDGFETEIGTGDFGEEFDKKLIGSKVGDSLSVQISYTEEEHPYDMGAGVVSYEIKIVSAYEEVLPEITDELVEEACGVESVEALRAWVVASLTDTYEYNSVFQLRENLLEQVIQNSKINKCSDALYQEAKKTVENDYLSNFAMFDITTMEEIYETFEMTEADLEEEILDIAYRAIVTRAICERENLELTDKEYEERLADYLIDWGYETEEELFADYGEDFIYNSIQEDKVMDFLIDNATITERVALDSEYE